MLSADLNYEIFQFRGMSHVFRMTGSGVLMNTIDKYYGVGYGVRWYFGSEGTRIKTKRQGGRPSASLQSLGTMLVLISVVITWLYRPDAAGEEISNDRRRNRRPCRNYVW